MTQRGSGGNELTSADESGLPDWIARHGLSVGELYFTNDSDLVLEYVGVAQVHDDHGMSLVMVFREQGRDGPMLTMGERDSEACGGYTPIGDHLAWRIRRSDST